MHQDLRVSPVRKAEMENQALSVVMVDLVLEVSKEHQGLQENRVSRVHLVRWECQVHLVQLDRKAKRDRKVRTAKKVLKVHRVPEVCQARRALVELLAKQAKRAALAWVDRREKPERKADLARQVYLAEWAPGVPLARKDRQGPRANVAHRALWVQRVPMARSVHRGQLVNSVGRVCRARRAQKVSQENQVKPALLDRQAPSASRAPLDPGVSPEFLETKDHPD